MAMTAADLVAKLVVNGQEYTRWKGIKVQRDWHTIPSVFTFVCAEPGPFGQGWSALRLKPGDQAQVYLGGVLAATCYITTRTAAYSPDSHDLVVSGKSIECDIVDSSVDVQPGTFNNMTFEQVANSVLAPHGVKMVTQNVPSIFSKPFKSLVPQFGETAFEILARMCTVRGVDMTDDEHGNVVVGNGDPSPAPVAELEEGRNTLWARGTLADETLWSKLSLVGQNVAYDDQDWPPRDYSATQQNPNTRPNRKKLMMAETPADAQDLQQRGNLEAARSWWPSVQVTVCVRGWKKDDGTLWKPVENVSIKSPMLFPSESGSMVLGIQSVVFSQDDATGTTTTLTLVLPQALSQNGDLNTPAAGGGGDPLSSPLPDQSQPDSPDST